jgi:ATP synthase protein I
MESSDARIFRGAAIPTALAGVVAALISILLAGPKGLLGSLIGLAVVVVFFSISMIAVNWAAKISPQTMMAAALLSYAVKLLGMFVLIALLNGVTAWNPRAFAWTVIALTLVWILSEARATIKLRTPYVVPDSEAKR